MDLPANEDQIKIEKLPDSKKMQWIAWVDVDMSISSYTQFVLNKDCMSR